MSSQCIGGTVGEISEVEACRLVGLIAFVFHSPAKSDKKSNQVPNAQVIILNQDLKTSLGP